MAVEKDVPLSRWVGGVVATALVVGAGYTFIGVKDTAEGAHVLAWQIAQKAAVLESKSEDMDRRLERIEAKLDELLKRK